MFRVFRAMSTPRRPLRTVLATAAALGALGMTAGTAAGAAPIGSGTGALPESVVTGPDGRDLPGDLNGDGTNDIWNTDSSGRLRMYADLGNGQFAPATDGGQTFTGAWVTSRGDWGEDGHNDLVALVPGPEGRKGLWEYPNDGSGVATTANVDSGAQRLWVECPTVQAPDDDNPFGCERADDHWYDADQVVAPGDINGDGNPDLLVKEGGALWAYYGERATKRLDMYGPPALVSASGWDGTTVVAPGDLNGDGLADLLVRDDASGTLSRVYGAAGPVAGVLNPASWAAPGARAAVGVAPTATDYPVLASSGDITGDGVPDLWGRAADDTVTGWAGTVGGDDWTGVGAPFTIADA